MKPMTPVLLDQINEAKRLSLVLTAQLEALARGQRLEHHTSMSETILNRLVGRLADIRMNAQLVRRSGPDEKENATGWQYEAPR